MTDDEFEEALAKWRRRLRLRDVLERAGIEVEEPPANVVEHYSESGQSIDVELLNLDEQRESDSTDDNDLDDDDDQQT